jgi:hypothetical protein
MRQEMQQDVGYYIIGKRLFIKRVSKPSFSFKPSNLKQAKGGHGLPKDSSRLQTMTAFNQKFLRGGPGVAGVRRTRPIRDGFVSEDVFHSFTCTCNLHLSPLAESAPTRLLKFESQDFVAHFDFMDHVHSCCHFSKDGVTAV